MYYTLAHRSECEELRAVSLLRIQNCAFAIAVRCMVVVRKLIVLCWNVFQIKVLRGGEKWIPHTVTTVFSYS